MVTKYKVGDYVEAQFETVDKCGGYSGVKSGDCGIVVDDNRPCSLEVMFPHVDDSYHELGGFYIMAKQLKRLFRFGR